MGLYKREIANTVSRTATNAIRFQNFQLNCVELLKLFEHWQNRKLIILENKAISLVLLFFSKSLN
jgi:hypothetical protein